MMADRSSKTALTLLEVLLALAVFSICLPAITGFFSVKIAAQADLETLNKVIDIRRYIKDNLDCPKTLKSPVCNMPRGEVGLLSASGEVFIEKVQTIGAYDVRSFCGHDLGRDRIQIEIQRRNTSQPWADLFDGIPQVCPSGASRPCVIGEECAPVCPYFAGDQGNLLDLEKDLGMSLEEIYRKGSDLKRVRRERVAHPLPGPLSKYVREIEGIPNGFQGDDYQYVVYRQWTREPSSAGRYLVTIYDARSEGCRIAVTPIIGARGFAGCIDYRAQILMANGARKKILDVRVGDWVFNPALGSGVLVTGTTDGAESASLVKVQVEDRSLLVTATHPFVLTDGTVRTAKGLSVGDRLVSGSIISGLTQSTSAQSYVVNLTLGEVDDPLLHVFMADGIATGDLFLQERFEGLTPPPADENRARLRSF